MGSPNLPLKFIRRQAKKTQEEMGKLLGKTQGGYSDIENGRQKLSSPEMKIICRELNIDSNIFTTDLPESEWYRFLNRPQVAMEPEPVYGLKPEKSPVTLILMEKERIEKELEAYREENMKLKTFIRQHCAEMQ